MPGPKCLLSSTITYNPPQTEDDKKTKCLVPMCPLLGGSTVYIMYTFDTSGAEETLSETVSLPTECVVTSQLIVLEEGGVKLARCGTDHDPCGTTQRHIDTAQTV